MELLSVAETQMKDTMTPVLDYSRTVVGVWYKGVYIPTDTDLCLYDNLQAFDEWRQQRRAAIVCLVEQIDPRLVNLYDLALAQNPELEGCSLSLPRNRQEKEFVRKTMGCFKATYDGDVGRPTVIIDRSDEESMQRFITYQPTYIACLAKFTGISEAQLCSQTELVRDYTFLHEFGHAAHFFDTYFTSGASDVVQTTLLFNRQYSANIQTLRECKKPIDDNAADLSELYWNMPFEKEANDFAKKIFRQAFVEG